ncbi:MAG TPA: hypothetical protein PKD31_15710 [Blastocatellia bacterium]|nr:hypothetical protein [Blastocatellia bacterium]
MSFNNGFSRDSECVRGLRVLVNLAAQYRPGFLLQLIRRQPECGHGLRQFDHVLSDLVNVQPGSQTWPNSRLESGRNLGNRRRCVERINAKFTKLIGGNRKSGIDGVKPFKLDSFSVPELADTADHGRDANAQRFQFGISLNACLPDRSER